MRPNYFDYARYQPRGPYAHQADCSPCRAIAELLAALSAQVGIWTHRARTRGELARLDLRILRDIGVTPSEAAAEISKPFWRA